MDNSDPRFRDPEQPLPWAAERTGWLRAAGQWLWDNLLVVLALAVGGTGAVTLAVGVYLLRPLVLMIALRILHDTFDQRIPAPGFITCVAAVVLLNVIFGSRGEIKVKCGHKDS